jgi:hypothetical protein
LAWAIDKTILTPLSSLASKQAAPTKTTMEQCLQILNYVASQEDTIITYNASQFTAMPLICWNWKLAAKKGHMFMAGNKDIQNNNGAVLNTSQLIKAVMSSVAEAELGALFINAKMAVSMKKPQRIRPPTNTNPHPNEQHHCACTTHQ